LKNCLRQFQNNNLGKKYFLGGGKNKILEIPDLGWKFQLMPTDRHTNGEYTTIKFVLLTPCRHCGHREIWQNTMDFNPNKKNGFKTGTTDILYLW
jgi:hypothetical protein